MANGASSEPYLIVPAVEPRRPFRITRLPLLSRLDRAALRPRRRWGRRFVGRPARTLLRWAYRLGLGGTGGFVLRADGHDIALAFAARNLQFNALYLPQYVDGYERETVAVIERALGPNGVFFDVGANWGYFSLHVASQPGFAGAVVAFEPYPASTADLARLVTAARLDRLIAWHAVALGDRAGEAMIGVPDGLRSGFARLSASAGVKVRLARLDALDLPRPDVIKIDVEGHEGGVLEGARGVIARDRPLIVFESWRRPAEAGAIMRPFDLLDGLGYRFFQPAALVSVDGVRVPLDAGRTGDRMPYPAGRQDYALVPFRPAQRFLLAEGSINVVACAAERVEALAARLKGA